jgi:translation initiation factor IF-2
VPAKKVRVYELARELGLTNKEALDLCVSLGIGVKSHSSSIEEAQADRVRRKADAEGLRREVQPAEPEPEKKTAKKATKAVKATKVAKTTKAVKKEEPISEETPSEPALRPAAVIRSGAIPPPKPVARVEKRPSAPAARQPSAPPRGVDPNAGPRSSSGRPIPPPPAGMRSSSGKQIPPPPGGRSFTPPQRGGDRQDRQGGQGGGDRQGFRGNREGSQGNRSGQGGGGRGGGQGGYRGGGAPPGRVGVGRIPGIAAVRGAQQQTPPGGGRGGPRQGGRRTGVKRKRKADDRDELVPMQATRYEPSNAPVPEGEIIIERGSSAQEIGPKLNRSAADVVRFLLGQGEMVTATQSLSDLAIELFAAEIGATVQLVDPGQEKEAELQLKYMVEEEEKDEDLRTRPPIITVMGHVDHGKTSLLDKIRTTSVVAGESGGITQHIGAYQVDHKGRLITFIDTPGHEAFTAMRARGAQVTDIAVLVVAADDGVMPQTIEAIDHAKAASVPIVVAINKIDRDDANPERVMQQLSEHGLVPEAWGGETIMVPVSAQNGTGIDDLLEQITLVADIQLEQRLRANPEGTARGTVLEAHLDIGRGPVATIIVGNGTLRVGDAMVAGAAWGRIRALIDYNGDQLKEAPPSTPVEVLGLSTVPTAGDNFYVVESDRIAREIGETREQMQRHAGLAVTPSFGSAEQHATKLEDLFEQIQAGEVATLYLILKADVQGSLEALTEAMRKLEREEVKLVFLRRAVGGITQSDIELAATSGASVIGFNVRPDRKARELAEQQSVEIRTYEIIYKVLEDIEAALVGMLKPEYEEIVTGEAEVREVFRVPKVGAIAGCFVRSGVITRGSKVRFLRDGTVIWKGAINSLKRFKDDAREVREGFECGIGLSDFQDLKAGDIIETYDEREIART